MELEFDLGGQKIRAFHLPGADSILLPSDNATFDPVNKRIINLELAKVFFEYAIDRYKISTHKKC